jgi:hypothetical protein
MNEYDSDRERIERGLRNGLAISVTVWVLLAIFWRWVRS